MCDQPNTTKKRSRRPSLFSVLMIIPIAALLALQTAYWAALCPFFRCPSIERELLSHPFLDARDIGGCKQLRGEVHITYLFVNEDGNAWSDTEIADAMATYDKQTAMLSEAAAARGTSLSFTSAKAVAECTSLIKLSGWTDGTDEALQSAGLPERDRINRYLAKQYDADSAFVVFCLRREARSFAIQRTEPLGDESVMLYNDSTDRFSLMHEILHLYGAQDYYMPEDAVTQAKELFDNSIMLSSETADIDPLTAYLVGWTDQAEESAVTFLQNTAHFTEQMLLEANEKETFTGSVTDYDLNGNLYTGELVDGSPHGQGTLLYDNGGSYTGQWDNGRYHGKGTLVWDSGDRYEGDFKNGVRTGLGTLTWIEGDKYIGEFLDNKQHGQGTITWISGNVYSGGWQHGVRTGQGTFTWANGDKYVGEWKNDTRHGFGTVYWKNGDSYAGNWENGERCGYGEYRWSTGACYKGRWKNNERNGHGVYVSPSGKTLEGEWIDGELQE